jgi:hypothetical protein
VGVFVGIVVFVYHFIHFFICIPLWVSMFDMESKSRPQLSVAEGGVTPVFADEEQGFQRVSQGFMRRVEVKNDSENVPAEPAILAGCGGSHVTVSQAPPLSRIKHSACQIKYYDSILD